MGVHDTYCVICGMPDEGIEFLVCMDLDNLEHIITNKKIRIPSKSKKTPRSFINKTQEVDSKILSKCKKLSNNLRKLKKITNWMNDIYLVTDDKVIRSVVGFDKGDCGSYDEYTVVKFMWKSSGIRRHKNTNSINRALQCHKSCYKLLEKKFNYKLQIKDVENIVNDSSLLVKYGHPVVNKYTDYQLFEWLSVILNYDFINFETSIINNKKLEINKNNINLISNPLRNKVNQKRILSVWSPIIKKIKRKESKTKQKKSKSKHKESKTRCRKCRPSPTESATLYKVGKKKKGNDSNMYIIIENKNKVKRWKKV